MTSKSSDKEAEYTLQAEGPLPCHKLGSLVTTRRLITEPMSHKDIAHWEGTAMDGRCLC